MSEIASSRGKRPPQVPSSLPAKLIAIQKKNFQKKKRKTD